MTHKTVRWQSVAVASGLALIAAASFHGLDTAPPSAAVSTAAVMARPVMSAPAVTAPSVAPAPVAPVVETDSAETITLSDEERAALAAELASWVTRHPRELVEVIANLAAQQPLPVPPTYLLSIAWAETRGKILAVSPAGAAGLAQATPAAYLLEGFDGKLYVTTDYLTGTRAYILKKPLGDALSISAPLLGTNDAPSRREALALTARAIELRREGFDELEALRPVGTETFFRRIAEGDAHNLATLQELERIIERGVPPAELKAFRTRVQRDYTYLRNLQRAQWEQYAKDLTTRRDALLRKRFGQSPAHVIAARPYEAGEYLGKVLDARFSPEAMVRFLAAHLESKQAQARALGVDDEGLHAWTAALYNGGALNIKRMQAGLIGTLVETQKYMKAVPARMARLDRAIS